MERRRPQSDMSLSIKGHRRNEAPSPSLFLLRAPYWPTQPEARKPKSAIDEVHKMSQ